MADRPGRKRKADKVKRRHRFFLNAHKGKAFSKCPICETSTKIHKFVFVINIKPKQLFLMNIPCRYCRECDLIIARKKEVESIMADRLSQEKIEGIENKYSVMGTLDTKDWMEGSSGALSPQEITDRMYAFRDVWNFDIAPAGWSPEEK
jgi:YgiT-type zinc finger domain-containing protein